MSAARSIDDFAALPGYELIVEGLSDLARGEETVASLLVGIAANSLRHVGLEVPELELGPGASPYLEHRLYALLARADEDSAHGRYNALVRRLVSFERALSCVG